MSCETYQQLEGKCYKTKIELIKWVPETFEIRKSRINLWLKDSQNEAIDNFAIGDSISGLSGMFLSTPLTAVLKVIFDHIEPLKPSGFLLGNNVKTRQKFHFIKRPAQ